ncbi:MAG: cytochrome b/b6 domain-containing protein [Proteobacteria bacterium]|nr:cytochrome b/b6 domain-containing protein [Pseudomonadota bacterium]
MYRPDEIAPPDPWDIVVRVTHWVIAGVVIANALMTEGGSTLHVALGWIGMGCLALRLIWGVAGAPEARFSAFPPRIIPALSHLNRLRKGKSREFRSHNPAGALMIYAFWAMLAIMFATGLAMTRAATPWEVARQQDAVAAGDWSALATNDGSEGMQAASIGEDDHWIEELHGFGADLLLLLAVFHLGGVVLESRLLRRSLVRPMLLGRRR